MLSTPAVSNSAETEGTRSGGVPPAGSLMGKIWKTQKKAKISF